MKITGKNRAIILVLIILFVNMSACQTSSVQVVENDEGGNSEVNETGVVDTQVQKEEEANSTSHTGTSLFEIITKKNIKTEANETDVVYTQVQEKEETNSTSYSGASSYEAITKRGIKRSNDTIVINKQIVDTQKTSISDEQLMQMLSDAKIATNEGRYEDAIKIADAILKDRPANESTLALKENAEILLEGKKHDTVMAQLEKEDVYERNRYFENLREKAIPYNDKMKFPPQDEWDGFKQRVIKEDMGKRLEESREHTERLQVAPSPTQNILSQEMRDALSKKLSIEFIDTSLRDVVSFLQEKIKLNFVLGEDAVDANVNIKLKDVSVNTILKYILPQGLDLVIRDDVIHITLEPLELRVYDVRDLLINLEDSQHLVTLSAPTTEWSPPPETFLGENKDTFYRVEEIMDLIMDTIEPESWSEKGGRGMIAAREGMLGDIVVTHATNIHKQVEGLLASLRSSTDIQVNIEARFIAVSDKFLEEFGHDILNFSTQQHEGGNLKDDFIQNIEDNEFIDTGILPGAGLNLGWQVFEGFLWMQGFLKAVQESEEAETITAPNITLSNTQRGRIRVVTTNNYISSYLIVGDNPQPVIEQIDDGTTLNVRPIVSADRKYVSLEVHPVITSVDLIGPNTSFTYETSTEGTGGSQGSVTTNTIQLPITSVQELSVTVSVPDRGVLLIGGLGVSTETRTSTGVPILSKIPIIKRLFSSEKIDIDRKNNLIILIKPTILIREEEETHAFARGNKEAKFKYRMR